jgi:hypothetical protein
MLITMAVLLKNQMGDEVSWEYDGSDRERIAASIEALLQELDPRVSRPREYDRKLWEDNWRHLVSDESASAQISTLLFGQYLTVTPEVEACREIFEHLTAAADTDALSAGDQDLLTRAAERCTWLAGALRKSVTALRKVGGNDESILRLVGMTVTLTLNDVIDEPFRPLFGPLVDTFHTDIDEQIEAGRAQLHAEAEEALTAFALTVGTTWLVAHGDLEKVFVNGWRKAVLDNTRRLGGPDAAAHNERLQEMSDALFAAIDERPYSPTGISRYSTPDDLLEQLQSATEEFRADIAEQMTFGRYGSVGSCISGLRQEVTPLLRDALRRTVSDFAADESPATHARIALRVMSESPFLRAVMPNFHARTEFVLALRSAVSEDWQSQAWQQASGAKIDAAPFTSPNASTPSPVRKSFDIAKRWLRNAGLAVSTFSTFYGLGAAGAATWAVFRAADVGFTPPGSNPATARRTPPIMPHPTHIPTPGTGSARVPGINETLPPYTSSPTSPLPISGGPTLTNPGTGTARPTVSPTSKTPQPSKSPTPTTPTTSQTSEPDPTTSATPDPQPTTPEPTPTTEAPVLPVEVPTIKVPDIVPDLPAIGDATEGLVTAMRVREQVGGLVTLNADIVPESVAESARRETPGKTVSSLTL